MIDCYGSLPHYRDHLRPIYDALPERLRGRWLDHTASRRDLDAPDLCVVAGFRDVDTLARRRRIVYVEHGAGQTYAGHPDPAFGNGAHMHPERIVGYICPRWDVAEMFAHVTGKLAIAVGCPRLDRFHAATHVTGGAEFATEPVTVALAFHWDNPLCPESRSALAYYEPALEAAIRAWTARGASIVGHGHPRAAHALAEAYGRLRVRYEPDPNVVLESADLLLADNTSLMYEFAALDRPVVALNAPSYRRHVEHGLRFWSHTPGQQINSRDELVRFDPVWHVQHDPWSDKRHRVVEYVYAHRDGLASHRAAAFLTELHEGGFDG